jgi:inhibitor of cysteine peptidase
MMHKRTSAIAGLVIAALALTGTLVALAMSTDEPGEAAVYTIDDHGSAIALQPGESFTVVLEGNPTTGYGWQMSGLDTAVLTAAEPEFVSDSDLLGAGGEYRFTFTASGSGETQLELVYLRPWEQAAPLETFTMTVTVP